VRELGAERPVPCLTLSSKPLPAGWTRPGEEAWEHYATLAFDYAGHRIAAGDPREVVEHADGDTLLRITRARRAEVAAVRRLRALQLVAVAAMGPAGDPDVYVASGDLPHWVSLLREGFPALERDGWHIERAPGFRLSLVEPERWYADVADSGDWFDLELGIEVEGQRVPLLPVVLALTRDLTKLAAEGRPLADLPTDGWWPYPLPRGGILRLPVQRVRTILATLLELYDPRTEAAPGLRLPRLAAHRLSELDGLAAGGIAWAGADALRAFGERLRNPRVQGEVEPPRGLRAKLRDYQLAGLRWLQFLRELGLGGVLADDMGLGKTVQTLAHLLLEREAGRLDRPALVVAPTSLVVNWRRETARFAPDLRVLVLHGLERKARFEAVPRHDLVLTTYPLLARDLERLSRYEYHVLVLDEAQHIKNPKTKASRAARTLHARQRLCLTGTPMENHLGELWSLFDLLLPGFLGDETRFRRAFRVPIEQHGDEARRTALTRRVAPFLLRRTKTEVARELPPKTEITRTVALAGGQRDLYETVRASMHAKVRQAIARRGLERSRIEVLEALLRLREICCDPRLLEGEGARAVRESAKLELLLEMLPALVEEGRRVLVYSQFTRMLALIEPELTRLGLPFVKLTGQTRDRATPVDRFQAGEIPIFLISLKAGGTGLNLTAADTVIHYDPWWNPAVERQASGRAHRIGQDKPVFVYRLLTEGTVEEKIAELQARKAALADAVFGEGTGVASALTATDLEGLFDPL
jgi:superfamily II DNA or RNA helicase